MQRSVVLMLVASMILPLALSTANAVVAPVAGTTGGVLAKCEASGAPDQKACLFKPLVYVTQVRTTVTWVAAPPAPGVTNGNCHTVNFGISDITDGANPAQLQVENTVQAEYTDARATVNGATGFAADAALALADPHLSVRGSSIFCDTDGNPSVSVTFDEPGVYFYYCQPHSENGMHGVVIVQPSVEPPA